MKSFIPFALCALVITLPHTHAADVEEGEAVTATELATQLGLHTSSIVYQAPQPFTHASIELVHRRGKKVGELVTMNYMFDEPRTELSIKVLVSEKASTVFVGQWFCRGKGTKLAQPWIVSTPPTQSEAGRFVLFSELKHSGPATGTGNIKSRIELIIGTAR